MLQSAVIGENAENPTITTQNVQTSSLSKTTTAKQDIIPHLLPEFSPKQKQLITESWPYVESYYSEVRLNFK